MKSKVLFAAALVAAAGLVATLASLLLWQPQVFAAAEAAAGPVIDPAVRQWGLVAAALSTAIGSLAAGYAVAMVATAAVGALTEKPELFGRMVILVGLSEGIAIYGLIVSVLILNRI